MTKCKNATIKQIKYSRKIFKKIFSLQKFFIILRRVFHGIRFKVRGLIVGRQLIFLFLGTFACPESKKFRIFAFGMPRCFKRKGGSSEPRDLSSIHTYKESYMSTSRASLPVRIWRFYYEGFRSMTVGRYLWAMIIFKLIIFFFVIKLFFFPNVLKTDYDNDVDRAEAVRTALTSPRGE